MKEVEFINSRVEQDGSQPHTDDYPPMTVTSGTSEHEEGSALMLTLEERKECVKGLKNCTDALTIYRFTCDIRIESKNGKEDTNDEDFDFYERIIKLREDSFYVSNLLEDLIDNIESQGTYDVLIHEISESTKRQNDEIAVARDYAEARKTISDLQQRLEEEKKANAREKEELKSKLFRFKNEKERLQCKVGIESRYVRDLEKARCENRTMRCRIALETLEENLHNLSLKEKNERRVSREIQAFLHHNVMENKKKTSQWQSRYDQEMQMYQTDNKDLRVAIENKSKVLEKLQLEYRERQEFIDTYIAEKDEARERKKLEDHRRGCAIRIQAWWRGVMVRRKLGPYRPDEKKKKRPVKSKK